MSRLLLVFLAASTLPGPTPQEPQPGYDDTPQLPGMAWKVHDRERPRPIEVVPGAGAGLGAPAPSDALVLFDGGDLEAWQSAGLRAWKVEDGAMAPVIGAGDLHSKQAFGDCQLHIEFRSPTEDDGNGQGRGNSGVFLMGRYEVQVLDSWRNPTYADGQAAALYGQYPPLVNASRAPGEWQAYDILFRAPRFDAEGALLEPARVTVLHNGVLVQWDRELLGPTRHRTLPQYEAHETRLPLKLQDHGDAVRFRNLWIRDLQQDEAEAQ